MIFQKHRDGKMKMSKMMFVSGFFSAREVRRKKFTPKDFEKTLGSSVHEGRDAQQLY